MKKSLKYIKIKGTLKSRGEYITDSAEYRPYEAVTIVDNEGEEIHFHTLLIAKRMDDNLDFNQPMSFYILRRRDKDKMVGVLYAVESEGKKLFYPDTAIPKLKGLGLTASMRYPFIINSSILVLILVIGGALSIALVTGLGFHPTIAMVLGFGVTGFYMYSPLIFQAKRAGLSEMKKQLTADGFDTGTGTGTNSKY